ncbi:MAG: hypothetical protein ACD_7C00581G0016 [uncultured bacterium]|nr:MAG: hypothetical protein ACD_7C00581G0016 [uncultured bacterium]HBR79991.1 hypothetical protein [Candidatus Moranbacteria bacterium]
MKTDNVNVERQLAIAEAFGIESADAIMEAAHMTYNAPRGINIVSACIAKLQEKIGEFQPKEVSRKRRKEPARAVLFGIKLANVTIGAAHLTDDVSMEMAVIRACIASLQQRIGSGEIKAVPAKPAYKKARYDKKDQPQEDTTAKEAV